MLAAPVADSDAERIALAPDALRRAVQHALALRERGARGLEPAPVLRLGAEAERAAARAAGERLLAAGRVAAVVVAGGQGTRLGFPGPKGAFPIGPVTDRSLFELQAQKLRRHERRLGARVPWIVMTSAATDAATRAFFAEHDDFGLEVSFVRQREAPSVDFEGRPLFAAPGVPVTSPDGHGGLLWALREAGLLEALAARGVEALAYHQVDNPLARMADPLLLGLLVTQQVEAASKVMRKARPDEGLATVGRHAGKTRLVEYTELAPEDAEAREPDGELRFWAGAIGLHAFSLEFLRSKAPRADELLPFHASAKRIPCLDAEGRPVAPPEPNGYKLERFVFDLLPEARALVFVEVAREDEYAPVKNAEGSDSPASARRALDACARRWLREAGFALPPASLAVELDHSVIDGPEDARRLPVRDALAAGPAVRVGPGALA